MKRIASLLFAAALCLILLSFPVGAAATRSPHTCVAGPWQIEEFGHRQYCTICNEVVTEGAHWGGEENCVSGKLCSTCGYEYTSPNENHVPDTSKWVARQGMYHYHPCTLCGAHCDTEDHRWSPTYLYQDATGHAWICADCKAISEIIPHEAGPAGTPDADVVCRDCGYVMAKAVSHTHSLTKVEQVPATCLEEGVIEYYTCSGCQERFADKNGNRQIPASQSLAIGALGHEASEDWERDGEYHWRICTRCQEVLDETKMVHADENNDGKCETCDSAVEKEKPAKETTPKTTEKEEPEKEEEDNDGQGLSWVHIVLVALFCFAGAITATVILLKKKKR